MSLYEQWRDNYDQFWTINCLKYVGFCITINFLIHPLKKKRLLSFSKTSNDPQMFAGWALSCQTDFHHRRKCGMSYHPCSKSLDFGGHKLMDSFCCELLCATLNISSWRRSFSTKTFIWFLFNMNSHVLH